MRKVDVRGAASEEAGIASIPIQDSDLGNELTN